MQGRHGSREKRVVALAVATRHLGGCRQRVRIQRFRTQKIPSIRTNLFRHRNQAENYPPSSIPALERIGGHGEGQDEREWRVEQRYRATAGIPFRSMIV